MPSASDILQFLRGQLFQTPQLPTSDFSGKTVVVTGANTGLGFECAKHLVKLNVATLVLGCRNLDKGLAAQKQILKGHGNSIITKIEVWELDMACFKSVKLFAERVNNSLPRLDALIANAGISTNIYHGAEGYEETLTVNVVSTFLLSLYCLLSLKATAENTGIPSHLVVVGSNVHCFADHTQLLIPSGQSILQTLSEERQADMKARYFLSKLMVMLCTQALAGRINTKRNTTSVIVNCPSPGWCKTNLFRVDDGGLVGRVMLRLIGRDAESGARTLVSAMNEGSESHGQYLSECQVKPASSWVGSQEGKHTQARLWKELAEAMEGISPGITGSL